MKIKFLSNLFITLIILKLVEARYPYAHPEIIMPVKCFVIGENANGSNDCMDFKGYYIPQTIRYSDYSSFTNWLKNDGTRENEEFFNTKCSSASSSSLSYLKSNVNDMLCNYVIATTINYCTQNYGLGKPSYSCQSDCKSYLSELRTSCPDEKYHSLENVCKYLKNCGEDIIKEGENEEDKSNEGETEKEGDESSKIDSTKKGEDKKDSDSKTEPPDNNKPIIPYDKKPVINKLENTNEDESESGYTGHINKNILYTLGFMIPLSLFIGFGFIYYRKRLNKEVDSERGSYSNHYSNNSGIQTYNSEHSLSSFSSHNKIFSIGLTDPKSISTMNIPIKNIDTREQDNMASNCVAELISTATMINAANNANNNIQPITPNEVNININTTLHYNTLSSHTSSPKQCTFNSPESSFSNFSNSSLKRKLPSYSYNEDKKNISLNRNTQQNSPLKHNFSQRPSITIDRDSTPIVDLSIYDSDPLLHIKKTNSFYHSSVSSETKKYNSFIAPISPIMSEKTLEKNHYSANKMENEKDGQTNKYTNHLLNNSRDEYEGEEDTNVEEIAEESQLEEDDEESYCTDTNNSNKTGSSIANSGASVIAYHHSSKYNSAKIPLSVMTVVQEFEPRMEDELKLKVNDRILLLKVFDDGWAVGLNQMTGRQGVFPMEYVVSSELVKSNNKFASQVEFRNALPSRTHSQAFSNFSFTTSTSMNDSVIQLSDSDFDVNCSNKSQSISSSKYYTKSTIFDNLRKSKLNNSSVIDD